MHQHKQMNTDVLCVKSVDTDQLVSKKPSYQFQSIHGFPPSLLIPRTKRMSGVGGGGGGRV